MSNKEKKPTEIEIINEFVDRYLGKIKGWPKPEENLVVVQTDKKQRVACLADSRGVLSILHEKNLYQPFLRYAKYLGDPKFMLSPNRARQIASHWLSLAPAWKWEDIPIFRFKSAEGYCWSRADIDPTPGPHPTWDEFCERISNAEAFKKFIGSIFFDDSYMQQYLVLWGPGNTGKGTVVRLLMDIFGSGAINKNRSPRRADKHYFEDCVGKRVVFFDDFEDVDAFSCGLFKSWTGDVPQTIDPKGQTPYQAKLNNKIIFTMNDTPEIRDSTADLRRAILCNVSPYKVRQKDWELRLNGEVGAFISSCMSFVSGCKDRIISVDKSSFELSTSNNYNRLAMYWMKYFKLSASHNDYVTAMEIEACFQDHGITSNKLKGELYTWLSDHCNVKRTHNGKQRIVRNIVRRKAFNGDGVEYKSVENDSRIAEETFWNGNAKCERLADEWDENVINLAKKD